MTAVTPVNAGSPARAHEDNRLDGWKVGTALAGIAGIASFQPSLLPRMPYQQGALTAASVALAFGAGVGANAIANKVDKETGLDAIGARGVVAGAAGLAVLGTSLALRGRPSNVLELARTTAGVIGGGAVLGAALIGEQALVDRYADQIPGGATAAHAAIFGAAALGTAALLLGRPRATGVTAEAEAAYIASVGGPQGSSKNLATFDSAGFEELTRLRAGMRTISGRAPGTRLPDGTVGMSGYRFLNEATPAATIASAMGVDAAAVKDPIRVYGGLRHGATREELAQKIFEEALELGAFDRRHVLLYLPSGTGHINPTAVAASEYLTLGDVASIGMQYGNKPSTMSLHKMKQATDLFKRVEAKFIEHIDTLPADRRPALVRYGESLGGVSLLKAFDATSPEAIGGAAGTSKLVAVGTPGFSEFRRTAVGGGYRLDPGGTVFDFDNIAQLRELSSQQRAGVNTFMLTHYNDPVSRFTPTLFFKRPEWLRDADQAAGIPRKMKYAPGVTGLQSLIDTMNGTQVKPGILERTGHDYRADLTPVMAEIFGTPTTDEQLGSIVRGLNQLELARVKGAPPMPRHEGPLTSTIAAMRATAATSSS